MIAELLRQAQGLQLSVSATTREPRAGELEGRDYHFLSDQEFDRRVAAGEFLEFATYSGHRYGTLRGEVDERLAAGISVVLEIEVQGARQIRAAVPDAVLVFIAPPSPQDLRLRLAARGTDSEEAIERRLRTAEEELAAQDEFSHRIVNDEVERAAGELAGVVGSQLRVDSLE